MWSRRQRSDLASEMVSQAPPVAPTRRSLNPHIARNIDLLRGAAACCVVVQHLGTVESLVPSARGNLGDELWANSGDGVFLFFAISGYLIGKPYVTALLRGSAFPRHQNYFRNRAARIYPAYLLAIVAATALATQPPVRLTGVISHIFLLQGVVPGQPYSVLGPGWTLGIEAEFYLAMPLLALLARRIGRGSIRPNKLAAAIGVAGLLSLGAALLQTQLQPDTYGYFTWYYNAPLAYGIADCLAHSLLETFIFFCPGLLVALLEEVVPAAYRQIRAQPILLVIASIALWAAVSVTIPLPDHEMVPLPDQVYGNWYLIWASSAIALCLASGGLLIAAHGLLRRSNILRALSWLGLISYGIYLWHQIVITLIARLGYDYRISSWASWPTVLTAALVLLITVPIATASYLFVERPAIRWAHRAALQNTRRGATSARPVA